MQQIPEFGEKLEHYNLIRQIVNADLGDTDEEMELVQKYKLLICKNYGHAFEIDHCGQEKHDFCYCCREYAVDLGYKRSPTFGKPTIHENRVWIK